MWETCFNFVSFKEAQWETGHEEGSKAKAAHWPRDITWDSTTSTESDIHSRPTAKG